MHWVIKAGISIFLIMGIVPLSVRAEEPMIAAVARAVDRVLLPSYDALIAAAAGQQKAMAQLCAEPTGEGLSSARHAFRPLLETFSAVEPYRFGPARTDNRFERLFFWPDPRGRGLKQVQGILAERDPSVLTPYDLQQKSVAVQGLPALDYILFGTYDLATAEADFQCRYALSIAGAILSTSTALRDDWGAFGAGMKAPGEENPIHRSAGEAIQELFRAAREQLQLLNDGKLRIVLQDGPASVKPKRAPFWRSGLSLVAVQGNLRGIAALIAAMDLGEVVLQTERNLADQLVREIDTARTAIDLASTDSTGDFESLLKDPDSHAQLRYAMIPIDGAITLLTEDIPAALGLITGFNSLDGD